MFISIQSIYVWLFDKFQCDSMCWHEFVHFNWSNLYISMRKMHARHVHDEWKKRKKCALLLFELERRRKTITFDCEAIDRCLANRRANQSMVAIEKLSTTFEPLRIGVRSRQTHFQLSELLNSTNFKHRDSLVNDSHVNVNDLNLFVKFYERYAIVHTRQNLHQDEFNVKGQRQCHHKNVSNGFRTHRPASRNNKNSVAAPTIRAHHTRKWIA